MKATEAKETAMSKHSLYDSIQKSISYAANDGQLFCCYRVNENEFHWNSFKKDMLRLMDDGFTINFGTFYGSRENLLNLHYYEGDFDEGEMNLFIHWEDC